MVHSAEPPLNNGISLATIDDSLVSFVVWANVLTRMARPVSIDPASKTLKWVIFGMTPAVHIPEGSVSINRVPTALVKTKYMRDPVPDWCYSMWLAVSARLNAGPLDTTEDCLLCTIAIGMGLKRPVENYRGKYRCRFCLCVWHMACAQNMSRQVSDVGPSFECPVCTV